MFRLFFVTITVLCAIRAQDVTENNKWSATWSTVVLSKYYGTIVGGIFYKSPIVFSDLNVSRKDRAGSTYIDFWGARPITRRGWNRDGGDEYDFTVGRSLITKNLLFDASGTYLAVHPLTTRNGHVWTATVRADYTKCRWATPYGQIYYFGKAGEKSPPAGWFFYGGAIKTLPARKSGLQADYRFGYSGGALGADWGPAYHRLTLSRAFTRGRVTLIPAIVGQVPMKRNDPLQVLGDRPRIFLTVTTVFRIK